ncbi:alpha-hydroxy acid oxidase [Merismopedia glauca]|uniref:Alpha-hydroxy-acid oxidizing enzyme n=1 Tax=Merismopedia glauca CCAP 1448/3 TaxID=1296344 RepID=A0A2T1C7T9_9CYAN|nr:alpha-hydroxy acid oxidase [Merismopedia glauca]PSB04207.1 alpha-hydroxy-acid oxidizing enzyme [Merismopedia glauca CCAP 1448/3]
MLNPINILEYEQLASKNLSQMAWDYYVSGAQDEITLNDNRAAFNRFKLLPKVLLDVSQRDLKTTILGQSLQLPILIAPMAFQCLANAEGELATAKVAAEFGIGMVLSTLATQSLEKVAAVSQNNPLWFQLYVHRDRGLTRALVERAYAAGFTALCLTVDAPLLGKRERDARNEFVLPQGMELANLVSLKDIEIPHAYRESGLFKYFAEQLNPALTWKDLEWLRSLTPLPLVIKGILRGDDAIKAVEFGIKAIIVSNHGGRQLDGSIATIDALSEIVEAVNHRVEILVDGGIRRGTDILKALALGAKAVLIGRPILWGLAVAGESGVRQVIDIYKDELDLAMALSGCASLSDIDSSLVRKNYE